jgi:hypothetical protein
MATLKDYLNADDDSSFNCNGHDLVDLIFYADSSYDIYSTKLRLFRGVGSGFTLTLSLQGDDGNGYPDGITLTSGTLAGTAISDSAPGSFVEFIFSSVYPVVQDATYHLVLSGWGSNDLYWRYKVGGGE